MATVVVIGAGLGGLPTAYELRHYLSAGHRVVLVSQEPNFTFIPGLIRVALDLNPLEHVQLNLTKLAQRHRLELVQSGVVALDPTQQRLTFANGETLNYDYLAIATGASLNLAAIPGLGPHGGYTHSVCTPDHAVAARTAWREFLEHPGPLVVGAAPGAGCFGPAYEFMLMADWELRRRGLRDRAPITYITPEPYVGHLGVSGIKNAERLTAELMKKRGIHSITNAEITRIEPNTIHTADGQSFPFAYSMILPSFLGASFIRNTPHLGNAKGFISTHADGRHRTFSNIYALGVAVELKQPDQTPVPIGLPKSGEMTEAMGLAVAHNIAVELGELNAPITTPTLEALCFAEFGDTGIAYMAVPVLGHPNPQDRRFSVAMQGPWVNWTKAAFEAYFIKKMEWGLGVPWFERLGLKTLFGVELTRSLPNSPQASQV
ncbi:FAD-dependent oxidoreductase [Spirulina major CS-329]|uniref:NAD(P)/FAD-dependent oxidoreductase n=1 Tax=Spirulina TaxID=1154 RepID=UPI00232C2DF1|nr:MULTISPECIES: FAD-dependent oxidoreductase [Spirulina]MDB9495625.1 FAD-dependent oxidoreductase [Spirulina subsalsa CS-330]MDB9503084.1 FAD-dependent oxidoreductase [Spirulina major CS-329]